MGDCKFGMTCRYHHPEESIISTQYGVLNPLGLPLQPVRFWFFFSSVLCFVFLKKIWSRSFMPDLVVMLIILNMFNCLQCGMTFHVSMQFLWMWSSILYSFFLTLVFIPLWQDYWWHLKKTTFLWTLITCLRYKMWSSYLSAAWKLFSYVMHTITFF